MKNKIYILFLILSAGIFNACEDPIPNDYIEQILVESYLIVDQPIANIRIMRSLPVMDKFVYEDSMVKDADVKIISNGEVFQLEYTQKEGEYGYYYPDLNYKVKADTKYDLRITLANGDLITGSTTTPLGTRWLKPPKKEFYFPQDTNKLPFVDSLNISWEKVEGVDFYALMLKPLDTLEYGKYLNPPTEELNRRILKPWSDDDQFFETTTWVVFPSTEAPVVWAAFKWYGVHEIAIYVPDFNYLRWYIQSIGRPNIDPLLSSVEGASGVFGSVSAIRDTFFLRQNIPIK
jgi:hypothetical protein